MQPPCGIGCRGCIDRLWAAFVARACSSAGAYSPTPVHLQGTCSAPTASAPVTQLTSLTTFFRACPFPSSPPPTAFAGKPSFVTGSSSSSSNKALAPGAHQSNIIRTCEYNPHYPFLNCPPPCRPCRQPHACSCVPVRDMQQSDSICTSHTALISHRPSASPSFSLPLPLRCSHCRQPKVCHRQQQQQQQERQLTRGYPSPYVHTRACRA
jgi:hypothetical protein